RRTLQRVSPSLSTQRQHREGHHLSPHGGTTGGATLSQHRSDQSTHRGAGLALDTSGDARTGYPGTYLTSSGRTGADVCSGVDRTGGGTTLCPRSYIGCPTGRLLATLPSAVGPLGVSLVAG